MIEKTYAAPPLPSTMHQIFPRRYQQPSRQQQQQSGVQAQMKHDPRDLYAATKRNITIEEYMRRDKIVREAYRLCPLRVGQVCKPIKPEAFEKYGEVRIVGITSCYYDYDADGEWPTNDMPRLISFICVDVNKGNGTFVCTNNYLAEPC